MLVVAIFVDRIMNPYPIHRKRAKIQALSLARRDDGVTAIEFALLAPALLLIVMGVIEFSLISFVSTVMESATAITARLGKTGYVPTTMTRQQEIINSIDTKTSGLLNKNLITVVTKAYSSFAVIGGEPCLTATCGAGTANVDYVDVNGNNQWDADLGQAGLGGPGDAVVYTVSYPWRIMTPIISSIIGSTYNITVRTVVRNEPYATVP